MLLGDCIVSDVPALAVITENMGMDTYNSAKSLNLYKKFVNDILIPVLLQIKNDGLNIRLGLRRDDDGFSFNGCHTFF